MNKQYIKEYKNGNSLTCPRGFSHVGFTFQKLVETVYYRDWKQSPFSVQQTKIERGTFKKGTKRADMDYEIVK